MAMNKGIFLMGGLLLAARLVTAQPGTGSGAVDPAWTKQVGARTAPAGGLVISVNSYGARKDGSVLATRAIQSAIDDCSKKGGGVVVFQPGTYLTGSVFLK